MNRAKAVLAVAALMVTGCSSDGQEERAAGGSAPSLTLPSHFPEFPGPPGAAEVVLRESSESWNTNLGGGTVPGSSVTYRVEYRLRTAVEAIRDHYHVVLPAAGWVVVDDVDNSYPAQPGTAFTILAQRTDRFSGTITAKPEGATSSLAVFVTEHLPERPPFSEPPLLALPAWVAALPSPPDAAAQISLRMYSSAEAPADVISVGYRIDGADQDTFEATIEHYRSVLPAAGWTILDEAFTSRDQRDVQTLDVQGRGTVGYLTLNLDRSLDQSSPPILIGFQLTERDPAG
jgi:hypothetical protein